TPTAPRAAESTLTATTTPTTTTTPTATTSAPPGTRTIERPQPSAAVTLSTARPLEELRQSSPVGAATTDTHGPPPAPKPGAHARRAAWYMGSEQASEHCRAGQRAGTGSPWRALRNRRHWSLNGRAPLRRRRLRPRAAPSSHRVLQSPHARRIH